MEEQKINLRIGNLLKNNLDILKEFPKHDWDNVLLVVGGEGNGKTTFVKIASYYLDSTVNIERWAYNAQQFEKILDRDDLPKGANVIWDESDELSQHWANNIVQVMKRKFKRIRKKNLTIWLITPTFFDMNKYLAISRSRVLFEVIAEPKYVDGKFTANRGWVNIFNRNSKRLLYVRGKKDWNMKAYKCEQWDNFGKVPNNYPISDEALEAKKDEAMKELLLQDNSPSKTLADYKLGCIGRFYSFRELEPVSRWTHARVAEVFDMDVKTLYSYRKKADVLVSFQGDILNNKVGKSGTLMKDYPSSSEVLE